MVSKAQVYLATAVGAFLGTLAFRHFNSKPTPASEEVQRESSTSSPDYSLSQRDIDDLEDQVKDLERLVLIWENIVKAYPKEQKTADHCIKELRLNIERHRDAIVSVQTVLNLQSA